MYGEQMSAMVSTRGKVSVGGGANDPHSLGLRD